MADAHESTAPRRASDAPAQIAHIGANVHAIQRTSPQDASRRECQAAIITEVLGDPRSVHAPLVNLVVFGDSPEGTGVAFVHAASYDEPGEVYAKRGTWHWPH